MLANQVLHWVCLGGDINRENNKTHPTLHKLT